MSSLENTIGEVIAEAADIQHKVPGKGDSAPAAMSSPDADEPKKDSEAAKKAGDATKPAPKTNKADNGDSMEVASDGKTKVEKGKAVNQEEVESDEDVVSEMADMTKSEMLKAAVEKMKEMSGKELQAMYSKMETSEKDGEEDEQSESLTRNAIIRKVVESLKDQEISEVTNFMAELDNDADDGDSKEKLKKTTKTEEDSVEEGELPDALKKAIAKKKGEEEEEVKKEEIEIDMTDDINALVADEDLSEEFKAKAKTIFEAAVASKVKEQMTEAEAKLEEETTQKIEEIKDDLTEKVDNYLNYVSESWVTENELAIERGLKSELTEDFINGLKKLFEEHYVEVPEDKFDVVEELANRLDEMEDKLNEEVASNIVAQQDIEELQREKIISESSNDLADTQVEKLKALLEDVDFENVENFVEKVSTLKESYFGIKTLEAVSDDSTVVSEDADFSGKGDVAQPMNESMSKYTSALSKFSKLDA
jgi:hypothetical protein|tara:strand:- start:633 stop:2072 length:1440 start_codon:yes stop_codon:yes gene_type:complete